jgi:16S rRNA (guanine(966)-N(2))-methyltransferase RsmD
MRIIAGEFRSRRLKSLPGADTRPTPDRLRETLFDILQTRIEGATFLDAYAGTGAVGIEALSRGASHAWFLEKNRDAVELIRENIAALKLERRATVVKGAAALTISRHRADIVFLDPPYEHEREYVAVLEQLAETPPQLVIAQHSVRFKLPDEQGALRRTRTVRQGDNALSFYAAKPVELTPTDAAPRPPIWQMEHSVEAGVPRDLAWSFMSKVSNWSDPPAEFTLDGPFADGARGTTLLPGQPPLSWSLRNVRSPETYTVVGDLGGATFSAIWWFTPIGAYRTRLTQRLVLEGENGAAFRDPIADAFGPNLAPGMEKIAAAIERSLRSDSSPQLESN